MGPWQAASPRPPSSSQRVTGGRSHEELVTCHPTSWARWDHRSGHDPRRAGTCRARDSRDGAPPTRAGVARSLARAAPQTSQTGCWTCGVYCRSTGLNRLGWSRWLPHQPIDPADHLRRRWRVHEFAAAAGLSLRDVREVGTMLPAEKTLDEWFAAYQRERLGSAARTLFAVRRAVGVLLQLDRDGSAAPISGPSDPSGGTSCTRACWPQAAVRRLVSTRRTPEGRNAAPETSGSLSHSFSRELRSRRASDWG